MEKYKCLSCGKEVSIPNGSEQPRCKNKNCPWYGKIMTFVGYR